MRKRSPLILLVTLGISLLAVGTVLGQEGGDPEHGAEIYAENCAVCHGPTGEGRIGRELNAAFASVNVDAFLTQTIEEGRPGTFMPAWSEANGGPLSDEDIADVIAYIETWGTGSEPVLPPPRPPAEPIPPVPGVVGDPNVGAIVFAENCVACHGESGEGRIGETLAKDFASVEPGAYVLTVVSEGIDGSLMPAWGEANGGPLSEDDIQNVTAYVLSLQPIGTSQQPEGETTEPAPALPLVIVATVVALALLVGGWLSQRSQSRQE